jgi:hypothetical protein
MIAGRMAFLRDLRAMGDQRDWSDVEIEFSDFVGLLDENAKLRDLVDRNRYALSRTFSANDWRHGVSDACSDIDATLARLDPTRAEVTGRG